MSSFRSIPFRQCIRILSQILPREDQNELVNQLRDICSYRPSDNGFLILVCVPFRSKTYHAQKGTFHEETQDMN